MSNINNKLFENLKILSIIPARGKSKRLPRKNIKMLQGRPLIVYSIEKGLKSNYIDKVVVSTEDREIAEISKQYNVEIIERPNELAQDNTLTTPVIKQVIEFLENNRNYKPDIIVILQPTSPLRKVVDIDKCIEKLVKEKCDSVITLKKVVHPPHWIVQLDKQGRVQNLPGLNKIKSMYDIENIYMPNGAVFVSWRNSIMKNDTLKGPDTRAVIMPLERSVDIDTEFDFFVAEKLMNKGIK